MSDSLVPVCRLIKSYKIIKSMTYFEIKIQPSSEASSDVVLVDNFHPRWREGARRLMGGKIQEVMQAYTDMIRKWAQMPISLEFSDYGLHHISLPDRKALDLWPEQQQYRSHNIHSPADVTAVTAVISHYIGWLNFAIRDLHANE